MKKILFTLALVATAALSAFAQNTLTKEYNFGRITEIEASSIFNIEVVQGDTKTVKVVYDEIFAERLEISCEDEKLELELTNAPFKRDNSKNNAGIKVYLQMPTIEDIELSGATKLKAEGIFETDEMEIELSGAATVTGLQARGNELSIDCSGATQLQISAQFKEIDVEMSGAAKISYTGDSRSLDGDFSGAVGASFYGYHDYTDIECSGATKITMEGETDYLKAIVSGACKFQGEKYPAKGGEIEVTGASKAEVRCTGDLKVRVSGPSRLTHYGNPNIINLNNDDKIVKGDK